MTPRGPRAFLVVGALGPGLTCAPPPPALRPPVQDGAEAAPESQDTVTRSRPPAPTACAPGTPNYRAFRVALEDPGPSFSPCPLNSFGGVVGGVLGPGHGLGDKPGDGPAMKGHAPLQPRRHSAFDADGGLQAEGSGAARVLVCV
ncbi:hypothetical protein HPG69_005603 [Diceros bicornis minor]|uniref:Uncharacterized protein n=1 Tax=Diceros bicornis minor TaxID=77932 RepID=A0A7J7EIU3_DICBM|nr:hypothetical protein HPG69_005603 [Diceros bicornis minor]